MTAAKKLEPVQETDSPAPVFTFTPQHGDPIELPSILTVAPDKKFLWRLHKMNFLSQTWEWMDRANVPDDVQARIVDLDDDEYARLFNEWFADAGVTPGE